MSNNLVLKQINNNVNDKRSMEREELIKLIMERIYTRRIYAEKLADDILRLSSFRHSK
jgi:hypothetical protein